MSIKTLHPALTEERRAEWRLMRDAMDGESVVKARGETYLPKPDGFKNNPQTEAALYEAYKLRAQFPEILAPSVAAMIGIIHGKEINIEMPDAMAFLWEDADGNGLPLEAFHRRITRELLVIGAYGVLADAPIEGGDPFLAGYSRDALINWDRDWWVVDETTIRRKGFVWEQLERYRVFYIGNAGYEQTIFEAPGLSPVEVPIRGLGGAVLPRVPFVVGTARDLSPRIEAPPLVGVARAALAIYQLSADYRWQLYMSGQETLVAINGAGPSMIGAGVVHEMTGAEGLTPDLKYVSPSCSGIEAHKAAIEDVRTQAVQAGARIMEHAVGQESGSARALRFGSEMATLTSIAQNSCALLERSLRNVAMLMGLGEAAEGEIVVTPPDNLLDQTITPAEAEALLRVWQGGGMSWETYYANLQRGGIASPERDADEEYALIDGQRDTGDEADLTALTGQQTERNRADGT
jgi:hypothetical protein